MRVISYADFAKKMNWDKLPTNLRELDDYMHKQPESLVVSMSERGKSNIYNVFAWPKIPAENTDAFTSLKQFGMSVEMWHIRHFGLTKINLIAGPHKRNYYDVVTDPKLDTAKVVHYDMRTLFGHFYNAIWYEDFDLYQDLLYRVKNFVHYRSEWFERAERIIKQLGPFSAIHIRRYVSLMNTVHNYNHVNIAGVLQRWLPIQDAKGPVVRHNLREHEEFVQRRRDTVAGHGRDWYGEIGARRTACLPRTVRDLNAAIISAIRVIFHYVVLTGH